MTWLLTSPKSLIERGRQADGQKKGKKKKGVLVTTKVVDCTIFFMFILVFPFTWQCHKKPEDRQMNGNCLKNETWSSSKLHSKKPNSRTVAKSYLYIFGCFSGMQRGLQRKQQRKSCWSKFSWFLMISLSIHIYLFYSYVNGTRTSVCWLDWLIILILLFRSSSYGPEPIFWANLVVAAFSALKYGNY